MHTFFLYVKGCKKNGEESEKDMKMDELLFKKTFIHVVREDANFI
jgi:hypothetical protein